ncbi:argonaute 5 [Tyrophagus putrescentiae]|nr:argonaute 5 [Tyrophagus putrescentiae]
MADYRGGGRGGSGFGGPRGGFQGGRGAGGARGGFRGGRGGGSFGADQNAPMPTTICPENKITQELAHGSEGRPIELMANFYKLTVSGDRSIYHYDIDVSREKKEPAVYESDFSLSDFDHSDSFSLSSSSSSDFEGAVNPNPNNERFLAKFVSQVIEKMLAKNETFTGVRHAHDGVKNLYTTTPYNFNGHNGIELAVRLNIDGERPEDFKVKVKLVEKVPVSEVIEYYARKKNDLSERVISLFEIFLRFIMGKHYVTFQRKLFDLNSITSSPQVRLAEFVSGFTSAVRMTEFGLALNVHLKTSCVISRSLTRVSDVAHEVAGIQIGRRPTKQQIMDFNRFIRSLRVYTKHSKREVQYTVDGLVDSTVYQIKFMCKKTGKKLALPITS